MYTRRSIVLGGIAVSLVPTSQLRAQSSCDVLDEATQSKISPRQAIDLLIAGNKQFMDGKTINCDLKAQIKATAAGQHPFAVVVGCIDSRVPPELMFDQHIGSIFVARVAGNVVNPDILASLEYACEHADAKAIVVLGHKGCGAVKAAIDDVLEGHLSGLLAQIRPTVKQVKATGERTSANTAFFDQVVSDNAKHAAHEIVERSHILSHLVKENKLIIAAAVDDIGSGQVTFIEEIKGPRPRVAKAKKGAAKSAVPHK